MIIKNMFRLICCGYGAVKGYFFVEQDTEYSPEASKRHRNGTIAQLPLTTCLTAGWSIAVCRAKTFMTVCW
jgi:hypothetical protein